jgi:hypothetical protein
MAGVSRGTLPDTALSRSVLEYGCITLDRAADCHMLKFEHIQYRCLSIALWLVQSTHAQAVYVIAAVEPLRLRFSMLNQRYMSNIDALLHVLKRL